MRRRITFSQNQLTLPFGEGGGMTISYDNRAHVFWTLATISILSLFIYILAISTTTRNIVIRQNLERQIIETSAKLDSLEFIYIGLKNDVTVELAHSYGFQEVRNPLYVSRTPATSLSFNTLNR